MSIAQRHPERSDPFFSPEGLTRSIGRELESLAALSAEVQLALSLCHFAEHTDVSAIRGLQGIDRITQSLEDLARLMQVLAGELPKGRRLAAAPLLANLRLRELRQRLSTEERAQAPAATPGDILWL